MTLLLKTDTMSEDLCREHYESISLKFHGEKERALRKDTLCGRILLHYALTVLFSQEDYTVICPERDKPYIKDSSIHFNLSHCGDYVLCAISGSPVGCDVEAVGEYKERIARRFFTERENLILGESNIPENDFFRLWVMKESILKQKGYGLSGGLDSYDFSDCLNRDSFGAHNLYFKLFNLGDAYACVCGEVIPEELTIISDDKITELFNSKGDNQ